MAIKRARTGRLGEELAQDFLKERGFHILETSYRCPEGEIDIVARHQDCLAFVEVRTKTSRRFGSPEESITAAKKKKMIATAQRYRQTHNIQLPLWRIDFIAVELDKKGKASRIELIENAVTET